MHADLDPEIRLDNKQIQQIDAAAALHDGVGAESGD